MYEVKYQDGHTAALAANLIADNPFAQVDEEGNRSVLFDEIVDVRTDGTQVLQQDAFVNTSRGSTTWKKLKDIKDSYPVQLVEYAVENRVSEEPAFT